MGRIRDGLTFDKGVAAGPTYRGGELQSRFLHPDSIR